MAGFATPQTLIPPTPWRLTDERSWLGNLANTLLVSSVGIVFATALGFLVGISRAYPKTGSCRKSQLRTWRSSATSRSCCSCSFRYNAVLKPLPMPRASIKLPGGIYLSNRGITIPDIQFHPGRWLVWLSRRPSFSASHSRSTPKVVQNRTGRQLPVLWASLAALIGLPAIAYIFEGSPISFTAPELRGFDHAGGDTLYPEFVALLIGLSVYTASYIAEIVRGGIRLSPTAKLKPPTHLDFRPEGHCVDHCASSPSHHNTSADEPILKSNQTCRLLSSLVIRIWCKSSPAPCLIRRGPQFRSWPSLFRSILPFRSRRRWR